MVLLRGLLAASLLVFIMGCGGAGGKEGDKEDPAATADEEQMQDETGEVDGEGDEKE